MSALRFIEAAYEALQRRGWGDDYHAGRLADLIITQANTPPIAPPPTPIYTIASDALHNVPNDRLIFEMLERGFAVMKLPEAGAPTMFVEP